MTHQARTFTRLQSLIAFFLFTSATQTVSREKRILMEITALSLNSASQTIELSEEHGPKSMIGFIRVTNYTDGSSVMSAECTINTTVLGVKTLSTGVFSIEIIEHLDHETLPEFWAQIMCSDKSSPPIQASVVYKLLIGDVNDNIPEFQPESLRASVTEGIPIGTSLLRVVALDRDPGHNGVIVYSIPLNIYSDSLENHNSDLFQIDEKSGEISTVAELDREEFEVFQFEVMASDKGNPPMFSFANVTIWVLDMNDNKPILITKELHIEENKKSKYLVGTLKAFDSDEGKNGAMLFALLEDSNEFQTEQTSYSRSTNLPFILKRNGKLLTSASLDSEAQDRYTMKVLVMDKGSPRLSSTGVVTIIVDDVNDAPIMNGTCLEDVRYIRENGNSSDDSSGKLGFIIIGSNDSMAVVDWACPNENKLVYQAVAIDDDSGQNGRLVYSIHSINGRDIVSEHKANSLFAMNEVTGEIYLRRYFLRSDSLQQIVNIRVMDRGHPPLSVYCGVSVTFDLNITELVVAPYDRNDSMAVTSLQTLVFMLSFLVAVTMNKRLVIK